MCYNKGTVKGARGNGIASKKIKKFQKTLDKPNKMCYNKGTTKEKEKTL